MVALNSTFATLTGLNARQLLEFSVNHLNLPAHPTDIGCGLRRILSRVVGNDKIRPVGRHRNPEEFHLLISGKSEDRPLFHAPAIKAIGDFMHIPNGFYRTRMFSAR